MTHAFILDKNDEKTRKHWLRFAIVLWIVIPSVLFLLSLLAYIEEPYNFKENSLLVFNFVGGILIFLILYLCAYKKPGTKFLNFSKILQIMSVVNGLSRYFKQTSDYWLLGTIIINGALVVYWVYMSEKLLNLNKRMKIHKNAPPEYWQSLESIKSAVNLEELEQKFSELTKKWPKFRPLSLPIYYDKKEILNFDLNKNNFIR